MPEALLLKINKWSSLYENNRTKELKKMEWLPIPNRMDGDGYTELLSHPNGAAHLGAWMALLQIASRCPIRGILSREGDRPHDVGSLSRISRVPEDIFLEAIPRLIQIGWISSEVIEIESVSEIPQKGAALESLLPQASAARRARASVPFPSIPFHSIPVVGREKNSQSLFEEEKEPDPLDAAILEAASRIHNRHPPKRNCGPKEISRLLRQIAMKFPKAERIDKMREVDENHAAWCTDEQWQKSEGEYAKGLASWLAPTYDRWNTRPALRAIQKPATIQPSRGQIANDLANQRFLASQKYHE